MSKRIPFINRVFAFILSCIFALSLMLSFFALPVELVFFNPVSYRAIIEKTEYEEIFPSILAETLMFQASASSKYPQIDLIANNETITAILSQRIPQELVKTTFEKVIEQMLAYLNFRIPTSDLKITTNELKVFLVNDSQAIAEQFLETLPNCQPADLDGINFDNEISAADLPACKPSGKTLNQVEGILAKAFEDIFNGLPNSYSLATIMPVDQRMPDRVFFYYSLIRWGFRLLPIFSILIFILIAVLLRNQRKVMWRWCGRLLLMVSALALIGLVVLVIGFDQFIAMLLNPFLKNLVSGFGYLLLGAVQDVGFQTLVWVVLSTLAVMVFGILLLLAVRVIPEEKEPIFENREDLEETGSENLEAGGLEDSSEDGSSEVELMQKTIQPETLEEIEKEEKKRKRNKKKDEI